MARDENPLPQILKELSKQSYAKKARISEELFRSELASLVSLAPRGEDWIHEKKYDGYRILARIENGKVTLFSRNHKNWTQRFSQIAELLKYFKVDSAIFDGEVVISGNKKGSEFSALQMALSEERADAFDYFIFDLLYLDGYDLRKAPLLARKKILEFLFKDKKTLKKIKLSPFVQGQGAKEFAKACKAQNEGIVSKRIDSSYEGHRGGDWLKVKCHQEEEFVIGGYTEPQGSRLGFGSLLLGYFSPKTKEFIYAGRVGTGFNEKSLIKLTKLLKEKEIAESPFSKGLTALERRGAHFTKPYYVAQIRFSEWTVDERLRHPAFLGLREDKAASEVTRAA